MPCDNVIAGITFSPFFNNTPVLSTGLSFESSPVATAIIPGYAPSNINMNEGISIGVSLEGCIL